jgi:hypothetical protein
MEESTGQGLSEAGSHASDGLGSVRGYRFGRSARVPLQQPTQQPLSPLSGPIYVRSTVPNALALLMRRVYEVVSRRQLKFL